MLGNHASHMVLAAVPGALVHRFFLAPDDLLQGFVAGQYICQIILGEGIQLFDSDNRRILELILAALLQQVVIHLAAAHDDALDLLRIQRIHLRNHGLERALGQIFQ